MERFFPKDNLYSKRIDSDYESVRALILPLLIELNDRKLQNRALIRIQQQHRFGIDTVFFKGLLIEDHVIYEEPREVSNFCETKIIINWDGLDSPTRHDETHEIEIEYELGNSMTLRFGDFLIDRDNSRKIPPKIKIDGNPRFREDLNLLMEELLTNP